MVCFEPLGSNCCSCATGVNVTVPVKLISREAGSGLHGLEYLGCVALDQANGEGPREAFQDGDEIVLV